MSNLQQVAQSIVRLMKEYGFNPDARFYQAGSMDEVLLRAIEGAEIHQNGYIHISGRDGQEYVSGNDSSMAVRWNGSRPNMSYLLVTSPQMTIDYYDTAMAIDRGGGETLGEWTQPTEEGGSTVFRNITYNAPINDNLYVGALLHLGLDDEKPIPIGMVMASILGNYMLINHLAPDRDMRYSHMIGSMKKAFPSLTMSEMGGAWKVPYYSVWITM